MTEEQKQSIDLGTDLVKQILTLATGALALTVTFAKDIAGPVVGSLSWIMPCVLYLSWSCLAISIFLGVLALGGAVGTAYGAVHGGGPLQMEKNFRTPILVQGWFFFAGMAVMFVFGIMAFATRKPPSQANHDLMLWTPAISGPGPQSPRFKLLGETRPFVKGSHTDWENDDDLARGRPTGEELVNQKVQCGALSSFYLVTGGADREPLGPSKPLYGENVQLAYSRALAVAEVVDRRVRACSPKTPPPVLALIRGPDTIALDANIRQQADDRTARLYYLGAGDTPNVPSGP